MVLLYWEKEHRTELDEATSQRFVRRREVAELSMMPTDVVIAAIKTNKRLAHIIVAARELASRYQPTAENNWKPSPTTRPRPAPRRTPTQLFPVTRNPGAPGSVGTPGGSASYGSGLAHNPGAAEAPNGYRCESCGAFVPDGAVHDCF